MSTAISNAFIQRYADEVEFHHQNTLSRYKGPVYTPVIYRSCAYCGTDDVIQGKNCRNCGAGHSDFNPRPQSQPITVMMSFATRRLDCRPGALFHCNSL